jgi:histidinol-phosphate aminotransferase
MYAVSAQVNDIAVVKVDLEVKAPGFPPSADAINAVLSSEAGKQVKLVYLCSPGNPTGALVPPAIVRAVLEHPIWNGVVVVDEAYVDFSPPRSSLAPWVTGYPNLVVMQTFSKAFGLAGIRLGAAFTSPEIAKLLNSLKAPYSISSLTSELAMSALGEEGLAVMRDNVAKILQQRERLVRELPKIPGVGSFLGGFDANFLLVEMLDTDATPNSVVALRVYERLAEVKNVVVRFRGKDTGCEGCLRFTVGTEKENDALLARLKDALMEVRG